MLSLNILKHPQELCLPHLLVFKSDYHTCLPLRCNQILLRCTQYTLIHLHRLCSHPGRLWRPPCLSKACGRSARITVPPSPISRELRNLIKDVNGYDAQRDEYSISMSSMTMIHDMANISGEHGIHQWQSITPIGDSNGDCHRRFLQVVPALATSAFLLFHHEMNMAPGFANVNERFIIIMMTRICHGTFIHENITRTLNKHMHANDNHTLMKAKCQRRA